VDVGLVGCIQSLKVFGHEFMKEYSLVYPESLDIQGARGLGMFVFTTIFKNL
jgi:hypothetical protein